MEDVNTFARLAARRVPVATLAQATGGRPERSTRFRELLAPAGIPHELRAAFVSRGRGWGAVHLARRAGEPAFDARDVAALAALAGVVAEGLRASLRVEAGRRAANGAAPGFVVLGPRDEVELITPPARELLAAMRPPGHAGDDDAPTSALLALAAFTRGAPAAADPEPHRVAVPTASGWITLYASLPDGGATGRVAIVLERAASPRVDRGPARGPRRHRP